MKKMLLVLLVAATTLLAEGLSLGSTSMNGQLTMEQVFNGFGCSGKNISPQLYWENVPQEAKSLAITMYDPDAPTGSGWWHWVVFNIPKGTRSIFQNASGTNRMPNGAIESLTDFGKSGFGGACPPQGDKAHAYITTVYALDVESLQLDANANAALVGYMINAHTIAKSSIITYYQR